MASMRAATLPPISCFNVAASVRQPAPVLGLPVMAISRSKIRCSQEEQPKAECAVPKSKSVMGAAAAIAAAAAAAAASGGPAMALVDERMSTEGTGLPFGLSNNLLGWILFGVFGLIWAFYTVYTSTLDEDEESGLSL